ncbi:hypothetical protein ACP70R_030492 [Stipagrostis hirtigluma subsp. patula]
METPLQYVSPPPGCACGACAQEMHSNAYAGGGTAERGFVQGLVTYTVTDDLTVTGKPFSHHRHAHVHHLRRHAAQRLRREGHRRPQVVAARLPRGE